MTLTIWLFPDDSSFYVGARVRTAGGHGNAGTVVEVYQAPDMDQPAVVVLLDTGGRVSVYAWSVVHLEAA